MRVSWDVALDLGAKKLKEIPKENIYNASYGGWGHAGSSCIVVIIWHGVFLTRL